MSSTNTKSTTWPYAYKTIGMYVSNPTYCLPYGVYIPATTNTPVRSEIALQIFPPLYIYKPTGLFMHLNYTFNSSLPTINQFLNGIYVRDTASSYIRNYGSTVEKYMPLNIQADVNRNINISLDLTSLLSGQPTNVVFLSFPPGNGQGPRGAVGGDSIALWKLDLVYQTIGIRNER